MKTVTLLRKHTHAGTEYPPGVTLTVSVSTADYLEENGIGRKVSAKATHTKKPQKLRGGSKP
jgi:hypothetical protein